MGQSKAHPAQDQYLPAAVVPVRRHRQLEGTIRTLLEDGTGSSSLPTTVPWSSMPTSAERNNKHKLVTDKYGLRNVHRTSLRSAGALRAQGHARPDDVHPDGIYLPGIFSTRTSCNCPRSRPTSLPPHGRRECFGGSCRAAPLDPRGDPRDCRRPVGHPARDPQRPLCRHGRHLCHTAAPGPCGSIRRTDPASPTGGHRRGVGLSPGLSPSIFFIRLAHERGLGVRYRW